jgi:hypothetical protein
LANEPVDSEIFVLIHHIFEHLMCLKPLNAEKFSGLLEVVRVNKFIEDQTKNVMDYYNEVVNIKTH